MNKIMDSPMGPAQMGPVHGPGPNGYIWIHMGTYGYIWIDIWIHMDKYIYIYIYMDTYG